MDLDTMSDDEFNRYMDTADLEGEVEVEEETELEQPTDEHSTETDSEDEEPIEEVVDDEPEEDSEEDTSDDGTEEEQPEEEETEAAEDIVDTEVKETGVDWNSVEWEPLNAVGTSIPISSKEELYKLASMGVDYTKKSQAMKPYRPMIEALTENDVSPDQVNLMIDAIKGKPEAIASLTKQAGLDPLDMDMDSTEDYIPTNYGKSQQELDIKDQIETLSADKEFDTTASIMGQWDNKSKEVVANNPELLTKLHSDVKSGRYTEYVGEAAKLKLLDGGQRSDIDYAIAAAQQYAQKVNQQVAQKPTLDVNKLYGELKQMGDVLKVKDTTKSRATSKKQANKRKSASIGKKASTGKTVVDYLSDSDKLGDEEFEKLFDKLGI